MLENLTKRIGRNPNNHSLYYQRARLYEKDALSLEEAEADYNMAIELTLSEPKTKTLYLVARANLYVHIGKHELAVTDMREINELGGADIGGLEGRYIENSLRDIARLDSIKATVAGLSELPAEFRRVFADLIDITSGLVVSVDSHNVRLGEHSVHLAEHNKGIEDLRDRVLQMEQSCETEHIRQSELQQQVKCLRQEALEYKESTERFEEILKDADILQTMIAREKLSQVEQTKIEEIERDPYKSAFYETLRWELNAGYLAATAIATGMIKSQQQGNLGKAGKVVKALSGAVPFVSSGVKLLGSIMVKVDANKQMPMMACYAHFVTDSIEMSILSEEIARELANAYLKVQAKKIGLLERARTYLLDKASTMKPVGEISDFAEALEGGAELFSNKITETGENIVASNIVGVHAESQGESDAKIIAQLIIGKILAGGIICNAHQMVEIIVAELTAHEIAKKVLYKLAESDDFVIKGDGIKNKYVELLSNTLCERWDSIKFIYDDDFVMNLAVKLRDLCGVNRQNHPGLKLRGDIPDADLINNMLDSALCDILCSIESYLWPLIFSEEDCMLLAGDAECEDVF